MTTLDRRLSDIGALADRVADQHDTDRDVTDLADRAVTGMLKALRGALEIHKPIDAVQYLGRNTTLRQVCTGCGSDDGNWQAWPCPTVRTINAAIRTTEPDELDRLVSAVDAGRDDHQRERAALGGVA